MGIPMRFFYLNVRRVKLTLLIASIFASFSLLSGCAGMMHKFGYEPVQKSDVKACMASTVLITNLQSGSYDRTYQLPNGRICDGVNNYEK